MGILGAVGSAVAGDFDSVLSAIKNPFQKPHALFKPDFPEGFEMVEIVDGKEDKTNAIQLVGDMMPMIPFQFGGKQKIVKEYYPGQKEPVVQVLGPQEKDIILHGRLKAKHLSNDGGSQEDTLYNFPDKMRELIDDMRIRGNLIKFTLGEWKRYGFLEDTDFKMAQLSRIDYQLTLTIVGFSTPTNCKFVEENKQLPTTANKDLSDAIDQLKSLFDVAPPGMPGSIAGLINGAISDVASICSAVTNVVNTALSVPESILGSLNKINGLIKNAQLTILRTQKRIGALQNDIAHLGTTFSLTPINTASTQNPYTRTQSLLTINTYKNAIYLMSAMSSMILIQSRLAVMKAQIATLQQSLPDARYLTKHGDTLQKIAIKFYNNADNWKLIYDHNKLSSTSLTDGTLLEIPKV